MPEVIGDSARVATPAVKGTHTAGGAAIQGTSDAGRGVAGFSQTGQAVYGLSVKQAGVVGDSREFDGVFGASAATAFSGVSGHNSANGNGVWGGSDGGRGVAGFSATWQGVYGYSDANAGVVGESKSFDGVWGMSKHPDHAGVSGHNEAGGWAGWFDGKVNITKDLLVGGDVIIPNADAAEDFNVRDGAEPGMVMVVGSDEVLEPCDHAYDGRVVGVVSGAGGYRPGIILDRSNLRAGRQPIALLGKVYCLADSAFGAIRAGDALTTSPTSGHAMRATERDRMVGAVLGKALGALTSGRGLIAVLVTLQ
jgi:hypothetical protein